MFKISIGKAIEVLAKIKIPYLTLFLAFLSSFNLWFLSIYFFKNDLLQTHGLIITLLVTLALTTSWFLITALYMPKYFLLMQWGMGIDAGDEDINNNSFVINVHIFLEVIFMHLIFLYLAYLFKWSFFILITVQFVFAVLLYFIISLHALKVYTKNNKIDK
jgi:hypothetical protein